MASVYKRVRPRPDRPDLVTWEARWRDLTGAQRKKSFGRKGDAERYATSIEHSMLTGAYVDPQAGKVTFGQYAEQWRASQVHRPTTEAHHETMLRRHVYPHLGHRPLAEIRPSEIQAWVKRLSDTLAPSTVGVVHRIVAGICKAAVRDRRVATSPCEGTKLPKRQPGRVEPLSTEAVAALLVVVPDRYRTLFVLAAGTGMRQGEVFGLTVDRINFLRRQVTVDRQLILVPGREPFLAPPKTAGQTEPSRSPGSSWTRWRPIWPPSRQDRTASSSPRRRVSRSGGRRSLPRCGNRPHGPPGSRRLRRSTASATTTRPCSSGTGSL